MDINYHSKVVYNKITEHSKVSVSREYNSVGVNY